jgi:predicted peptidase
MIPAGATQSLSLSVTVQASYRYLLYEPGGARAPRGLNPREAQVPPPDNTGLAPVVFFFHGKGERGDDLSLLERHGLPRLIAAGRQFPFLVISPQCPESDYWSDAPGLPEFIAAAIQRHQANPARVYLTGLSMGGFGVWSLAQRHPERYAAILPVCGGGETRWAPRLRDVPAWVFHGARDAVVPPARSIEMVEAIRAAGGTPRFTLYPDAGHDSWTETYANEEIYRWMLSHRRAG